MANAAPAEPEKQPTQGDIREANFRHIFGDLYDTARINLPPNITINYDFLRNIVTNLLLRSRGLALHHEKLRDGVLAMISREPQPHLGTFAVGMDPETGRPTVSWDAKFFDMVAKYMLPTAAYALAFARFIGHVLAHFWVTHHQQQQQAAIPEHISYLWGIALSDSLFADVKRAFIHANNSNALIWKTLDSLMLALRDITNPETKWIPEQARKPLTDAFSIHLIEPQVGIENFLNQLQETMQQLGVAVKVGGAASREAAPISIQTHLVDEARKTLHEMVNDAVMQARAYTELLYTGAASLYHEYLHYAFNHLGTVGERCRQIMLNAAARRIKELAAEKGDWVFTTRVEEGAPEEETKRETIVFSATDSEEEIEAKLRRLMAVCPPFQGMFHSEFNCAVDCVVNSFVLMWLSHGDTSTNSGIVPLFYLANMIHPALIGMEASTMLDNYARYYGRRYAENIFGKQEPPPPPPNGGDGYGPGNGWRRDARRRQFAGGDIKVPQPKKGEDDEQKEGKPKKGDGGKEDKDKEKEKEEEGKQQGEQARKEAEKLMRDIAKDMLSGRTYGLRDSPWEDLFKDLGGVVTEKELPPIELPWHDLAKNLLIQVLTMSRATRVAPPGEPGGGYYVKPLITRRGEGEVYRHRKEARVTPIIVLLTDTSGSMGPIFENVTVELLNALRNFAAHGIYSGNVWQIGQRFAQPLVLVGGVDDVLRLGLLRWAKVPRDTWVNEVGGMLAETHAASATDILGESALPLLFRLLSAQQQEHKELLSEIKRHLGGRLREEQEKHITQLMDDIRNFVRDADDVPVYIVVATDGYTPGISDKNDEKVAATWGAVTRLLASARNIRNVTLLFVLYPDSDVERAQRMFDSMCENLFGSIPAPTHGDVYLPGSGAETMKGKRYLVQGKEVNVIALLARRYHATHHTQEELMRDAVPTAAPQQVTPPAPPTAPSPPPEEEEPKGAPEEEREEPAPAPPEREDEREQPPAEQPTEQPTEQPAEQPEQQPTQGEEQKEQVDEREKERLKEMFRRALRKGFFGN